MQHERWMALAKRQAGLITRAQCRSLGVSDRQVDTLVSRGLANAVARGVLAVSGAPATSDRPLWRAVLATGGVLASSSAAFFWQLVPEAPASVRVILPRQVHRAAPGGVQILRADLPALEVVHRFGLPVTSRTRSALDHLACLSRVDATTFADRAVQQGWLTLADLQRRLETPRSGNPVVRRVLRTLKDGAEAESERRLQALLKSAGITGWRPNHRIVVAGHRIRIDLAFVRQKVAIEVDGFAYHSDRERFQRDRTKQNLLTVSGWTVLRFTWQDVTGAPADVVRVIRSALEVAA